MQPDTVPVRTRCRPKWPRKLNVAAVAEILNDLARGVPIAELANRHGVSYTAILDIRAGRTWKIVPRPAGIDPCTYRGTHLSPGRRAEILEAVADGEGDTSIARRHGIDRKTVYNLKMGRTWPNIPPPTPDPYPLPPQPGADKRS